MAAFGTLILTRVTLAVALPVPLPVPLLLPLPVPLPVTLGVALGVALGVRDANYDKFDIKPVLERLLLKGSIVVKKAYCDWERYKGFKATMHEANFELIEIPHVRQSGKNSADIRMVVDALDLCYTKAHVNTFVIISGDSDFSPLVSKLRENAKQGFWNGATPPLGYRIVAVEQKGARMKKRLEVDPVDAETVNLIFQLYSEGAEGSGPLGVKDVTKWLNGRGYRTRKGATFGVGPVHGILTNRCYATGKWPYGLRSSRTGQRHDPSEIVEVDIPKIISLDLFDAVQERLKRNNPKVTPPRVVNGPTLLTGIAVCGSCGAGMTRTGTRRGDKTYTYYSCAACHQKGKSVCKGRHVPVAQLDTQVIEGLKQKLFTPERMGKVLSSLRQRHAARDATVVERQRVLKVELNEIRSKLDRLNLAIENGVIELDDDIKGRIGSLKERRDIIEASLARITQNIGANVELDSDRIAKFSDLMQRKLEDGDVKTRRTYLSSVIDRIEVDDDAIRVFGRKDVLADAIAGRNSPAGNVSGFVRKWRAIYQ